MAAHMRCWKFASLCSRSLRRVNCSRARLSLSNVYINSCQARRSNMEVIKMVDEGNPKADYSAIALLAGLFGFFGKKDDPPEDVVILKLKMAKLAERQKNLDEADRLFHEALTILQQRKNKKEITYEEWVLSRNYVFDCMANLAFNKKEFEKAEVLFKDTLKGLLEAGVEKDDNSIVEISLKLSMIYALLKQETEAAQGYKFCISTMEKNLEKEPDDQNTAALLGLSIDSYARFLLLRHNYIESLKQMERSLELAIKVFGESHTQPLVIMNDIATVCMMTKDYDLGMKYMERAIKTGEKIKSPEMAAFYCNIGAIYLHKHQLEEAQRNCEHAAELAQKLGDKQSKLHAQSCLEQIKKITDKKN